MAKRNENGLTDLWQIFCDAYRTDQKGNAKAAYKIAYPNASDRTAEVESSKLLRKPEVRAYLDRKQKECEWNADITQERILKELSTIAFFDIRQIFNSNGELKTPTELEPEVARAISSVEVIKRIEQGDELETTEEYTHKIKANDKLRALDMLGKYLDIWKGDKNNNQLGVLAIPVPSDMSVDEWQRKFFPNQTPS